MAELKLIATLHYAQSGLAVWGIYNSYIAITKLQEWESISQAAAAFSTAARNQLNRTRTTQAAGLVGVVASLVASLTLGTAWQHLPHGLRTLASPAMIVLTLLVRGHLDNFWKNRTQLPMAKGYNEAIARTAQLMQTLEYLEYSWVLTSVVGAMAAYGTKAPVAA